MNHFTIKRGYINVVGTKLCVSATVVEECPLTGAFNSHYVRKRRAVFTKLNTAVAAEGTQAAIDAAKAKLIAGELHVFDVDTFTVKGQKLTTYLADVDTDENWTGDTEVIKDGYFHESEFRSAPYFDLDIDGITTLQ